MRFSKEFKSTDICGYVHLCILWLLVNGSPGAADDSIRFGRDILPILSDRCFQCHGPDENHREADLRLDLRESLLEDHGSGPILVPGRSDRSLLIERIASADPDLLMPPADSHRKPLSKREIELFRRWVDQGAPWGRHWSFELPQRKELPADSGHPVDYFVRLKFRQENLEAKNKQPAWRMSPPAEDAILLRRLSFDLIGLPPTPAELKEFQTDPSPNRYEKVVDRLLASPHFGERMAMWWLDAARYSDTDGYQQDATRNNWPWRDWVIKSFNENKPFDQFTIEQFAGDLLPNATTEQRLATCFHRNHMNNGEGGRHPEESRIDYVIDRVNTMGTVWLGLTLGCVQCHSHKFDPISQEEYYGLFAFFDSIDEDGKAGSGARPFMKYRSEFGQRDVRLAQAVVDFRNSRLQQQRTVAEQEFLQWLDPLLDSIDPKYQAWEPVRPLRVRSAEGTRFRIEDDATIQTIGPNPFQDDFRIVADCGGRRVTGFRLEVFPHPSHTDGKLSRGKSGEFILTDIKLQVQTRGQTQTIDVDVESARATAEKNVGGRNYGKVSGTLDDDPRNGWTTESHDPHRKYSAVFALRQPLDLQADQELIFVLLQRSTRGDANIGRFRISVCGEPGEAVRSFAETPREKLAREKQAFAERQKQNGSTGTLDRSAVSQETRNSLLKQFLLDHSAYQKRLQELELAKNQLADIKRKAGELNVMVLAERKEPRQTFVLQRGVWDQKGKQVVRSFPERLFGRLDVQPRTRLDLARWIVSKKNPLTARVIVNQLWQICFGKGLVRTPDDFGLQGELPTHPELLDWLAIEFIESGWDVKHMIRLMVTSETYRQSSRLTDFMRTRDPDNRLLARNNRYRLPSWMIRDAALRTSGLLNPAIGGPTVMPYQPAGVWEEIFMGRFRYQPSQGDFQFRRTVYAFWRRSSSPTFLFDSSQRRVCEVKPRRTNTPLQALTLLNDRSLLESSRQMAVIASRMPGPDDRVNHLFQSVLLRDPAPSEREVLLRELRRATDYYRKHPDQARAFLEFGQPENGVRADHVNIAALTVLASLIYNLDEAITRE